MISSKEKLYLIAKIVSIIFIALIILSIIRVLSLHADIVQSDLIYIVLLEETIFSIGSTIFVLLILFLILKKDIQKINAKALNLAFTDGLTGLYNRHYLNEFLSKFSLLRKEDTKFAIAFIDIDKFKKVNDTLGHATGDCILRCLAKSFKSLTRSKDILCRYGGEEFVIIFSDISEEEALSKVELIRSRVQEMLFECKQERVTISIGLSFGTKDDDINLIMEEADSALYMAKDAGRNRVEKFTKEYEN